MQLNRKLNIALANVEVYRIATVAVCYFDTIIQETTAHIKWGVIGNQIV